MKLQEYKKIMAKKVLTIRVSRVFAHRLEINILLGQRSDFIEATVNEELTKLEQKDSDLKKS